MISLDDAPLTNNKDLDEWFEQLVFVTRNQAIQTSHIQGQVSDKIMWINSPTFGAKGIQLDYNDGTPRFYCGDGSTKFLKFDGTNASVGGAIIAAGNINFDLDDIANGSSYGKVALTAISGGKIVLTGDGVSGTLAVGYTAAKCTDPNADQTSANAQNIGWLIGTAGTLTISSGGKLIINVGDALELQAANAMKCLAGTDIRMYSASGNPSEIQFITDNRVFSLGANFAQDELALYPETNNVGTLTIGRDASGGVKNFQAIYLHAEAALYFHLDDAGGNDMILNLDASAISVSTPDNYAFTPDSDARTYLGRTSTCWKGLYVVGDDFDTCSDGDKKINIAPETLGLDFINRLRPVMYDWDEAQMGGGANLCNKRGLIAQDVAQVMTDLGYPESDWVGVRRNRQIDPKTGSEKDFWTTKPLHFVFSLIKAMQELDAKMEAHLGQP